MKKLFTLFLLTIFFLGKSSLAQNTACNAGFNITYLSSNTIQFNPLITGDPSNTQHDWLFGDAGSSNLSAPVHTYLTAGTYIARHIIIRFATGTLVCRDTAYKTITIQSATTCNLVANFTVSPVTSAPNTFIFTNTSTPLNNSDSIRWTFGDGTSAGGPVVTHSYAQPGTYNVCLRVQQRNPNGVLTNCVKEICHTVTVPPTTTCNLVANFTISAVSPASNTFVFTNTSTPLNNSDSIRWTFGDGTSAGGSVVTHSYSQPGTYNVCLRVQQRNPNGVLTNCVREICHTVTVLPNTACNLVANFTISPVSPASNTFIFTNTSTPQNNSDSIRWTFGDGTSAGGHVVTHSYAQPGTYNVCLRVQQRNPNGVLTNCVREICHTVTVLPNTACNLVANFTISPVSPASNTFIFTNTSTPLNNSDSIRWTFGDGTSAGGPVVTHSYAQPGTYNVCLRVQQRNPNGVLTNCVREICHTVTVLPNTACNLVANFTISAVSPASNTFVFTNTSTPLNNSDSIRWTFADGTSAGGPVVTHSYAQPGTYNVCLRVQQRNPNGVLTNCVREICHTATVPPTTTCNLVASFTISPVLATPNTFHFTNTSTPLNNSDSIRWTFGDGTSSNQVSPNHTYTQPGTYNVCLRVQQRTNAGVLTNCVREVCHVVVVQGSSVCNLVANFTSTIAAGTISVVHFQNTSTPLNNTDSIRWTFGDGTSSNAVNPVHTYTQPGTYNVCLRIQQRNLNGTLSSCIREVCKIIVVPPITTCSLVANFTITSVTGSLNTFHFQNTSTPLNNSDSIRWTFGDGTSSNQVQPNHTYTQAGTYTVCLRIQQRNPNGGLTNCIREKCQTVVVQGPGSCNLVANFTFMPLTTAANSIYFQNTSSPLNTTDSVRWTFGDGTSSNQSNPIHTYLQPGSYVVCLRVQQRNQNGILTNCIREICRTVVVQGPNTCNLTANFHFYRIPSSGATLPYLYQFVNTSAPLNATDSILWTFGDGTSSNQVSPNHAYLQPGTYNVCLRIIKRSNTGLLTNCVREICHPVVVVAQSPAVCNLQAYPNPVSSVVNVNVYLTSPQMIDVYVYNSSNLQVKEKHQPGTIGNNIVTIAVADLQPGIYFMKVIRGNIICHTTFVKI